MKTLIFTLLLIPLMLSGQTNAPFTILENGMLTPQPAKVAEFEAGLAAHNKMFHATGMHGARVYWISNGPNVGKYMWVMGPLTWGAMDERPAREGHDADWNANVMPYMLAEGDQDYWRFHPELSNFPADFELKNLLVFIIDIKRFQEMAFIDKVVRKVQKLYMEKRPEEPYGVYTNQMANSLGKDFAWVDFFSSFSWMGEADTFPQDFEAVHGPGSFTQFLKDVEATTNGEREELWVFREDLSGLSGKVEATSRQ